MLKVVKDELLKTLAAQLAAFNSDGYEIGLFQNDWTPDDEDTISDVDPADFGGYSGLQPLDDWDDGGVVWDPPRAVGEHPDVVWTADGTSSNTIYGYYVVDGSGNLAWAERRSGGGVTVGTNGQTYTVSPRYTRRSEG